MQSGWTIEDVRRRGSERIDSFHAVAEGVDYERKGILFEEAFFVYASLGDAPPPRILESGRARGQSTLMLARCFPSSQILSIEYDPNSEDVPVAEKRLSGESNVELLFGDARERIPALLQDGDAVMIDGPKEHRALSLAFDVLGTGKCPVVFVHDCYKGSPIRALIEKLYPSALYSDDPDFVEAYRTLDEKQLPEDGVVGADEWSPYHFINKPQKSWGLTFACLPYLNSFSYAYAKGRVQLAALIYRLKRSVIKRHGSVDICI
jgi:hypothetical protein